MKLELPSKGSHPALEAAAGPPPWLPAQGTDVSEESQPFLSAHGTLLGISMALVVPRLRAKLPREIRRLQLPPNGNKFPEKMGIKS